MISNVKLAQGPRYQFVDEIINRDFVSDCVTGIYFYSGLEEWSLIDHFPDNPIMPANEQLALMIEVAQKTLKQKNNFIFEIHAANFKKIVKPNTELIISIFSQQNSEKEVMSNCIIIDKLNNELANCILIFSENTINPDQNNCIQKHLYSGMETFHAKDQLLGANRLIEAMAQNTSQLAQGKPELKGKYFLFQGLENANFTETVTPDSKLVLSSSIIWKDSNRYGQGYCQALVDSNVVATAIINFAVKKSPHLDKRAKIV